jgi:TPR repeat protein
MKGVWWGYGQIAESNYPRQGKEEHTVSNKFEKVQQAFDSGDYAQVLDAAIPFAENGHCTAQEMLGNCYQLGLATEVDEAKAVYWYQQAITLGSGLAANNLAGMVQCGYSGKPSNPEQAIALFKQARALGFEHSPRMD